MKFLKGLFSRGSEANDLIKFLCIVLKLSLTKGYFLYNFGRFKKFSFVNDPSNLSSNLSALEK